MWQCEQGEYSGSPDLGENKEYSFPHRQPDFLSYPLLQRFRFCGDLDCPDWVLAEISTLAKIVKCPGSLRVGRREA